MKRTNHPHLFAAVPLPDRIKSVLSEWSDELREHWSFHKWVYPSDYHITLQFLGGCSPEQTVQIKQRLSQAVTGQQPFALSVNGLGYFGQPHKPRILWAGVSGDRRDLGQLQQKVAAQLESIGFPQENRPYRPHITLAKKYRQNDFSADRLGSFRLPQGKETAWQVREFALYQTRLGEIPMYEPLETYSFHR